MNTLRNNKIVTKDEFSVLRGELGKAGKTVVMCHGVYDLLHYGHIEHLKEAKSFGDVLVVSVTAAPYVNKGPDRPYFSDEQRMEFLASIEYVDYVVLSEERTAVTNIRAIQPDFYVKGEEFRSGDGFTGQLRDEIAAITECGGEIRYTQGAVFSSSKLLNNYFGALPDGVAELSHTLIERYGSGLFDRIAGMIEELGRFKVLVVGDIIIDDYIFCQPQGLTSKDAILSTRFQEEEQYLGGALAIARHVASFCPQISLLSMMGEDAALHEKVAALMPSHLGLHILRDTNFVTPVKQRFLKRHLQRNDNEKLFSINYLNDEANLQAIDYTAFHAALREQLPLFDLVIVCDYGHGLLDAEAVAIIQKESRFLAVNCQTNSSNYGMNVITKYSRADTFTLDEKELALAFREYGIDKENQLERLRAQLGAKVAWLTVGANGAVAKAENECTVSAPALTLRVTDTVGAGDAFFSISSLCAAAGVPTDIATLLGNAAGAIKTHVIGNKDSVNKKDLLRFVKTILNV